MGGGGGGDGGQTGDKGQRSNQASNREKEEAVGRVERKEKHTHTGSVCVCETAPRRKGHLVSSLEQRGRPETKHTHSSASTLPSSTLPARRSEQLRKRSDLQPLRPGVGRGSALHSAVTHWLGCQAWRPRLLREPLCADGPAELDGAYTHSYTHGLHPPSAAGSSVLLSGHTQTRVPPHPNI